MSTTKDKTKLLFICLGNICRSPAAHAVMQQMVDNAGLTDQFLIDSAGIGGWHVGQLPDKRMRQRSEEHTSELQSPNISYAVFCLKKKKKTNINFRITKIHTYATLHKPFCAINIL